MSNLLKTPEGDLSSKIVYHLSEIKKLFGNSPTKVTFMLRNPLLLDGDVFLTEEADDEEMLRHVNRLAQKLRAKRGGILQ